MYELMEGGFQAVVGERSIVFQHSHFEDGRYYFEGEAAVSESGRLAFIVRFRERKNGAISPLMIDGAGEHEVADLILPTGSQEGGYYDAIYQYVLELLLISASSLPLIEFRVFGRECITKTAKPAEGGGGKVHVPKSWVGATVQVIR